MGISVFEMPHLFFSIFAMIPLMDIMGRKIMLMFYAG
jgi:hypothetical protein